MIKARKMPLRPDDPFGISVIVVNWNSRVELAACLNSLRAQTFDGFETIVVDNGSTDGSIEMVGRDFPEASLVATGTNLGFAEGVNRGLVVSSGSWIATLNNDATADPRWLEKLRMAAQAGRPDLGMLQSHIILSGAEKRINSTGLILFKNGTVMDRGFDSPDDHARWSEDIFCPTAGAALYKRSMLEEVRLGSGVFDKSFFMYFEDADLGWRCRLAGWSARYVPDAIVCHQFQGSANRHGSLFVARQTKRNRVLALIKNGSFPFMMRGLWRTMGDALWIAFRSGANALFDLISSIGGAFAQRQVVTRLARRSRRQVELEWVERRS
jgi:GT2 family glycosyltransferase